MNKILPALQKRLTGSPQMAPLYNALQGRGYEILEQSNQGLLLWNPESEIAMIAHEKNETALNWLKKHEADCAGYPLLVSLCASLSDVIEQAFSQKRREPCVQVLWTDRSQAPLPSVCDLKIRTAEKQDIEWISGRYALASLEELEQAAAADELFVLTEDDIPVGYAGIHSEGSMGMLEILPAYRHRGLAGYMEQHLAEQMRKKGLIPYAHIFQWNQPSIQLQKKLNLLFCQEEISWFIQDD